MDTQASSQFIASLIKSIQVVCHGNVEFNHNIEIVGHIYLHVDKSQKFNYVLNEEVVKDSESTKFLSNSFPAEPPHRETERKRRKVATPSSTTESDGATEVITVGNDADEISSRPSHPPSSVSAASPTIVVPSNLSSSIRQRPRRPSFPANQSALSSSESERTPPPRSIATSQAQTLSQPQTRVPGISLSSDVKPDVSGQTSTSVSHPLSSRDSYVSSNPSLSSVNSAAATTTTTSEPDIQIKLEVPSEEEVQLLSHEIAGQVGGTSHPSQSGDPNSSTGSAPLYPVMLHQNLAATHSRDPGVPSGSRAKRQHLESDIPALSSAYSIGQDDFNLHGSNLPGSSNKQPGSQWNHPPQRLLQDAPNDGLAEPMVHFDSSLMGPRLGGGPTSTVTSMTQDSSQGSLEARDAQLGVLKMDSSVFRGHGEEDSSGLDGDGDNSITGETQGEFDDFSLIGQTSSVNHLGVHRLSNDPARKSHVCVYCHQIFVRLTRHLCNSHPNEPEVEVAMALQDRGERSRAFRYLQERGDALFRALPPTQAGSDLC